MNATAFVCRVELHVFVFASRLAASHLCASGSLPFVFRAQDELRDLACLMLCLCCSLSLPLSLCLSFSRSPRVCVSDSVCIRLLASPHARLPVCFSFYLCIQFCLPVCIFQDSSENLILSILFMLRCLCAASDMSVCCTGILHDIA